MLDPRLFKANPAPIAALLKTRGYAFDLARFESLMQTRAALQGETESLQNERNKLSKQIGEVKARGEDAEQLLAAAADLGGKLKQTQTLLSDAQDAVQQVLSETPNLPGPDVPVGDGEEDNVEIRRWGAPREFEFTPLDHIGGQIGRRAIRGYARGYRAIASRARAIYAGFAHQ